MSRLLFLALGVVIGAASAWVLATLQARVEAELDQPWGPYEDDDGIQPAEDINHIAAQAMVERMP